MSDASKSPDSVKLDIAGNRRASKWSRRELVGRALWETIGRLLFSFSLRQMWGYRNAILRLFGADIGSNVHLFPTVKISVPWNLKIDEQAAVGDGAILYSLGLIHIGARATVSQYAHLCAGSHDHMRASFELVRAPISIGDDVWVCADAFIGPGVSVGARTIVGARSVVTKNLPSDVIVVGNPSKVIRERPKITD